MCCRRGKGDRSRDCDTSHLRPVVSQKRRRRGQHGPLSRRHPRCRTARACRSRERDTSHLGEVGSGNHRREGKMSRRRGRSRQPEKQVLKRERHARERPFTHWYLGNAQMAAAERGRQRNCRARRGSGGEVDESAERAARSRDVDISHLCAAAPLS